MKFSCGEVEGVGSMWMCRFVVFRLLLACYALCRHFVMLLPSFQCGSDSQFGRRPVRWFLEILVACGSKTRFGFSDSAPGVLLVFPGLHCLYVWFIKFWQRHAAVWVYSELGACLSLHVYWANVCSGKITLLHVYVCVCVCVLLLKEWVFWLLFFTFMLQYIWWLLFFRFMLQYSLLLFNSNFVGSVVYLVGFAASQRFHGRFEGCSTKEEVAEVWGNGS
jgi:hypothetical protein